MKYEYVKEDLEDYLEDYYFEPYQITPGEDLGLVPINDKYGTGSTLHSIKKKDEVFIISIKIEYRNLPSKIKKYKLKPGDELEMNLLLEGVACFMPPSHNPCLVRITDITEDTLETQIIGIEKQWAISRDLDKYTEEYLILMMRKMIKFLCEGKTKAKDKCVRNISKALDKNPALLPLFDVLSKKLLDIISDKDSTKE